MLAAGKKHTTLLAAGTRRAALLFRGTVRIWEAITSCFGSGRWRNDKPWKNNDSWKN